MLMMFRFHFERALIYDMVLPTNCSGICGDDFVCLLTSVLTLFLTGSSKSTTVSVKSVKPFAPLGKLLTPDSD